MMVTPTTITITTTITPDYIPLYISAGLTAHLCEPQYVRLFVDFPKLGTDVADKYTLLPRGVSGETSASFDSSLIRVLST